MSAMSASRSRSKNTNGSERTRTGSSSSTATMSPGWRRLSKRPIVTSWWQSSALANTWPRSWIRGAGERAARDESETNLPPVEGSSSRRGRCRRRRRCAVGPAPGVGDGVRHTSHNRRKLLLRVCYGYSHRDADGQAEHGDRAQRTNRDSVPVDTLSGSGAPVRPGEGRSGRRDPDGGFPLGLRRATSPAAVS